MLGCKHLFALIDAVEMVRECSFRIDHSAGRNCVRWLNCCDGLWIARSATRLT
jgi:hypothetical protein